MTQQLNLYPHSNYLYKYNFHTYAHLQAGFPLLGPEKRKKSCFRKHQIISIWCYLFFYGNNTREVINPWTPKIWLSILPSGYYTFPCGLIMRIRCSIKVINSIWWVWVFSWPVCCVMYQYYRENLHVNHFWELKD